MFRDCTELVSNEFTVSFQKSKSLGTDLASKEKIKTEEKKENIKTDEKN